MGWGPAEREISFTTCEEMRMLRGEEFPAAQHPWTQTARRSASPSAASTFVQYWKNRSRISSIVMPWP